MPDNHATHPRKGRFLACLIGLAGAVAPFVTAPADAADQSPDRVAEWIRQLDSDRFSDRRQASRELRARGKTVFPALSEAAAGKSREATMRALEILAGHYQNGDAETRQAAREALEGIAQQTETRGARLAKEILEPTPDPNPPVPVFRGAPAQVAQIRIQAIQILGGAARQVKIRTVNGNRTIEAKEKDRTVKIDEEANGKIAMEVTEKGANGKQVTKKYQAKDADDLKKNHPEAHKIYQQYSSGPGQAGAGGIRLQINGGAIPAR